MSNVEILPQVAAFLDRRHGCFIDGQWVLPKARQHCRGQPGHRANPMPKPWTRRWRSSSAPCSRRTGRSSPACGRACVRPTAAHPAELHRLVEEHAEELAQLETLSQGKSINMARALDLNATVEFMRYMAGWATKIEGQTFDVSIPLMPNAKFHSVHQP